MLKKKRDFYISSNGYRGSAPKMTHCARWHSACFSKNKLGRRNLPLICGRVLLKATMHDSSYQIFIRETKKKSYFTFITGGKFFP